MFNSNGVQFKADEFGPPPETKHKQARRREINNYEVVKVVMVITFGRSGVPTNTCYMLEWKRMHRGVVFLCVSRRNGYAPTLVLGIL